MLPTDHTRYYSYEYVALERRIDTFLLTFPNVQGTKSCSLRVSLDVDQGGEAFLLGTGATIAGYLFYGGLSFGLTEFLKRRFVEIAGPDLAALYPIPILLGARYATRRNPCWTIGALFDGCFPGNFLPMKTKIYLLDRRVSIPSSYSKDHVKESPPRHGADALLDVGYGNV